MVAEENKSAWADSDSEESSFGTSSSSEIEDEVQCLMADDTEESLFKKKKKRRWSWSEVADDEDQLEHGAKRERRSDVVLSFSRCFNVDDVIDDVIQSQDSAGSLHSRRKKKRRRRGDPVASYSAISRCYLELAIAKRCRLHKLIRQRFAITIKIQQEDFALLFQQTKLQCIQSQRKDIQSQDEPVASNSSIQSRAHMNQLLLLNQSQALHIQSTWFPGAKN
ncbi:hypothetical protein F511_24142 [Dorcoceras hygrometricum]|uniref:Uncharacterized protein n=1 Tax=Dorcoceras hygrometricum TaxID=472368 RepID=A0A2Z7BAQ7_9LAMI|nr:hypothetical protein F511_24142 [Dorcoceras hygrometricum]